ncbi:MAG: hypothetical protein ACOC4F_02095, partial [bacterium]
MKKMYVVLIALAALSACSNPAITARASGGPTGELVVSSVQPEGNGLQASTVFPEFELDDVESYTVALTNGPGGTGSHSTTVNTN